MGSSKALREFWAQRLLPGTGKIIFQDGFEDEIVRCLKDGTFGYTVVRDADLAFMGEASLKISTPATVGAQSYAEFPVPSTPSKKFGLDLHFAFPLSNGYRTAFEVIYIDQNGNWMQAAVRYELGAYVPGDFRIDGKWQYRNSAGVWTDISSFKLFWYSLERLRFARLKLIGDFAAEKYVSLTVNDTVFDLSAQPLYKLPTPSGHGPGIFNFLYNYNNPTVGGIADLYIDNLMVTDEG